MGPNARPWGVLRRPSASRRYRPGHEGISRQEHTLRSRRRDPTLARNRRHSHVRAGMVGVGLVVANTGICEFGWKARDFALGGVDGKTYTLADVRGRKGTLVAFICNHCPYVRAVIGRIVAEANALRPIGIGTIAIMPNDTNAYPEDSFENMKVFAVKHSFTFPYVIDATQEVAKAYRAQCTPDFFGFNAQDE